MKIRTLAVAMTAAAATVLVPATAHAYTGYVVSWAGNNDHGQANVPAALFAGATDIAVGTTHALAVKNGAVLAWGSNNWGETSVPAAAASGVTKVAASNTHSLAVKNGGVIAWGESGLGQTVVPAAAQSGVVAVAAGIGFSAALKADGTALTWGAALTQVTLSGVKAISAGPLEFLALKNDGTIIEYDRTVPVPLQTPNTTGLPIVAIKAGSWHHAALTATGHVITWVRGSATPVETSPSFSSNVRSLGGFSPKYGVVTHTNGSIEVRDMNTGATITPPAPLQSGVDRVDVGYTPDILWVVGLK
ncbi:RCC1 domain-containing protein [Actinokineospora sp. G85]|uniref:RCC1 domain-containing protein n=1 Tax=Actinokineospora sp. G85 TaxID=3406626 RepID=UPI003C75B216